MQKKLVVTVFTLFIPSRSPEPENEKECFYSVTTKDEGDKLLIKFNAHRTCVCVAVVGGVT